MSLIRVLPPLLVNQIAAGEVIERPASVVKELMENAIDAGAARIDVTIEQGGRERIQITDNGCGMSAEELPLAITPHATSKIESADDLDAIATMGFRGEALASIASVARLAITSRRTEDVAASLIEVEGDVVRPVRPASGPVGTTISVRNLFFNTPARRKFLKTEQTETSRVREVVHAMALSHPAIAFSLTSDDRKPRIFEARPAPARRALDVLGAELKDELLELRVEDDPMSLWGMIGRPAIARGTARHLHVFVNGRRVNDRTINHAIREAYRGLIDPTRHPTAVLFIVIDPAMVDVNVHPAKAEVRFRQQTHVHGSILHAIRGRLREADLTPQLPATSLVGGASMPLPEFSAGAMAGAASGVTARSGASTAPTGNGSSFVDYFRQLDPVQKGFVYTEVKQALADEAPDVLSRADRDAGRAQVPVADAGSHTQLVQPVTRAMPVLQISETFVVTQDEQGLVIIDQHALHERIMFEKLKSRMSSSGGLESQRLLMPAVVELERCQMELLDELKPLLERLGIDVEPIGPTSIAAHAFTTLLFTRGVDPVVFLSELFDRACNDGLPREDEAALHEVLDMMACKAAIKAGDMLSEHELNDLLAQRSRIERSSACPHGRPTSLRVSVAELEKRFGRR